MFASDARFNGMMRMGRNYNINCFTTVLPYLSVPPLFPSGDFQKVMLLTQRLGLQAAAKIFASLFHLVIFFAENLLRQEACQYAEISFQTAIPFAGNSRRQGNLSRIQCFVA